MSVKTNFQPHPQQRAEGTGAGRTLFPWKRCYPWLVIAAEQLIVAKACGAEQLLENRSWAAYGISPTWLGRQLEALFLGIGAHLKQQYQGKTPWTVTLQNRVYKMYYSGTSDRGEGHNPATRASVSREHWRNWPCRIMWEDKVLQIVSRQLRCRCWRGWL